MASPRWGFGAASGYCTVITKLVIIQEFFSFL